MRTGSGMIRQSGKELAHSPGVLTISPGSDVKEVRGTTLAQLVSPWQNSYLPATAEELASTPGDINPLLMGQADPGSLHPRR